MRWHDKNSRSKGRTTCVKGRAVAQQGFASPGKAPLKVSDDKLQPAWSAALHELAGKPQHLGPGHLSSWVTRDRSLHRSLATPCSLQRPFRPYGPWVRTHPFPEHHLPHVA